MQFDWLSDLIGLKALVWMLDVDKVLFQKLKRTTLFGFQDSGSMYAYLVGSLAVLGGDSKANIEEQPLALSEYL